MPEDPRTVTAAALAKCHVNKGWVWSLDNFIPAEAEFYVVYDGAQVLGGGLAPTEHAAPKIARAEMPIVFWLPRGKAA
jgi:hypothetical protein